MKRIPLPNLAKLEKAARTGGRSAMGKFTDARRFLATTFCYRCGHLVAEMGAYAWRKIRPTNHAVLFPPEPWDKQKSSHGKTSYACDPCGQAMHH